MNHIWIYYFPPFKLSQMLIDKNKNKWFDMISNKTEETGHGCQGKWQPQTTHTLLCSPLQSLWFVPSISLLITDQITCHMWGFFWQAGLSTDWVFSFLYDNHAMCVQEHWTSTRLLLFGLPVCFWVLSLREEIISFWFSCHKWLPFRPYGERREPPDASVLGESPPPSTCRLLTLLQRSPTLLSFIRPGIFY